MTKIDVRPFGLDQAVTAVESKSSSAVTSTCTIEGLMTRDNDGGASAFCPSSSAFPLGRPFGLVKAATPLKANVLPFGLKAAVAPEPIAIGDLSRFRYDHATQIGLTEVDGELVPLMRHTTGTTRTSTNPDGQKGPDSDADQRED
jgi:putative ATP-grasp target RiPP